VLLHYLAKARSLNFGKSDPVQLLEQAMPAFIPPDLWPQNSTDLNPVYQGYKIWGHHPAASLSVVGAQQ